MASAEDRLRLYSALMLEATMNEDRTIRPRGVFDPDVYLPGVLWAGATGSRCRKHPGSTRRP